MFIDISHLSARSEHHRAALLADAENFRLARQARRARRRGEMPRSHPPQPPEPSTGTPGPDAVRRDADTQSTYAVAR
jgi:hypothetical protein